MEKKSEEIIGYRIGQGLFCVECYKEGAKTLKAVQNPNDPEVKFPSRPITAEDVSVFICEQCKVIKGPSVGEVKIQEQKSLIELRDMICDCVSKIAFIEDFFANDHSSDTDWFSDNGKHGFYRILVDLQNDLNFVCNELPRSVQRA